MRPESSPEFTTVFFDVCGVLVSYGWDKRGRRLAAERFGLDAEELEALHRQFEHAMEKGEISLAEYLDRCIFDRPRAFSPEELFEFMSALSEPDEAVLALVRRLRASGRYRLATLNNECIELNQARIRRFELQHIFDTFCASSCLGARKPDLAIFERALAIVHQPPESCVFVDDREENLAPARRLGISGVLFTGAAQLERDLRALGLQF